MKRYQKRTSGSLTIEAAVFTPCMIFILTLFLSFFWMIYSEYSVQKGMYIASNRITSFLLFDAEQYARNSSKIMKGIWGMEDDSDSERREKDILIPLLEEKENDDNKDNIVKNAEMTLVANLYVKDEISTDYLRRQHVALNGYGCLVYAEEKEYLGTDCMEITTDILYDLPVIPGVSHLVPLQRKTLASLWKGRSLWKEEEEGQYVYVTQYGTVYHTQLDCRCIDLSIRMVSDAEISSAENKKGQHYTKCEKCPEEETSFYYVTNYGTLYHTSLDCSSLKRTITVIPMNETDLECCSYCEREGGQ